MLKSVSLKCALWILVSSRTRADVTPTEFNILVFKPYKIEQCSIEHLQISMCVNFTHFNCSKNIQQNFEIGM